MARVRLSPGGRERLNPLDPGPGDPELALLARQTLLAGMLGSVLRRDLTDRRGVDAGDRRRTPRRHATAAGTPATWSTWPACSGELPDELARHEHLSLLSPEAISTRR